MDEELIIKALTSIPDDRWVEVSEIDESYNAMLDPLFRAELIERDIHSIPNVRYVFRRSIKGSDRIQQYHQRKQGEKQNRGHWRINLAVVLLTVALTALTLWLVYQNYFYNSVPIHNSTPLSQSAEEQ